MRIKAKDMEEIDKTIKELSTVKAGQLKDARKEDIGFGIQIIKAAFLIDEKDDKALGNLEQQVNKLKTVEEAETIEMTLL